MVRRSLCMRYPELSFFPFAVYYFVFVCVCVRVCLYVILLLLRHHLKEIGAYIYVMYIRA